MISVHAPAEGREFLRAHGIDMDEERFSRLVERVVASFPRVVLTDPRVDLTPEEAAVLEEGGFDLTPRGLGDRDPVAVAAAEMAALVGSSLTVARAAKLLGVDPSRVRQRLTIDRSLFGFQWEGQWRIPAFQFERNRCLPGLGGVVSVLPKGLHPLSVLRWFTTPTADLRDDEIERDLSPREWLLLGHTAEEAAGIARFLS